MRVDTDDFARPRGCGKNHLVEVEEILIEPGAVNALEEAMSEGFLKEYISPLLICDTNTCKATEEIMEDIYDRCHVLVLDCLLYTSILRNGDLVSGSSISDKEAMLKGSRLHRKIQNLSSCEKIPSALPSTRRIRSSYSISFFRETSGW